MYDLGNIDNIFEEPFGGDRQGYAAEQSTWAAREASMKSNSSLLSCQTDASTLYDDIHLLMTSQIAGFDAHPPSAHGIVKHQMHYSNNHSPLPVYQSRPPPTTLNGDGSNHNNTLSTASGTMHSYQNDGQLEHQQDHTPRYHLSEARNPIEPSGLNHCMQCTPPDELHTKSRTPDLHAHNQLSFPSPSLHLPSDTQEPVEANISSLQSIELASTSNSSSCDASAASSDCRYDQPDSKRPSTLSLSVDETFLDPVHIFLRRDCIEVFEMTDEDAKGSLKRAGQVGLRCRYCKHLSKNELASQAVCFPSKRSTIFESIRNFKRFHLNECPCIPKQVKTEFECMEQQLSREKSTISQKYIKVYYMEAASELGLVDTPNGLVFGASPNTSGTPSPKLQSVINAARYPVYASNFWKVYSSASVAKKSSEKITLEDVATDATRRVIMKARKEPTVLVRPNDFPTVSDHHFVLYHQFIPSSSPQCTEQGSPVRIGLCCKHCSSRACAGVPKKKTDKGKFVQPNFKNFGDSYYVKKLLNHIITCDYAPKEVRNALEELQRLALEHRATSKKGSRLRFIKKVWSRLEEYSCIDN